MQKEDAEYTKLTADLILATKGFLDYGEDKGLLTPEGLKFTITKRQEIVKQLVDSGLSQRQAAKVLGVDKRTIGADLGVGRKAPKNGAKGPTSKPPSFGDKFSKYVDAGLAIRRAIDGLTKEKFNEKRWADIQSILEEIRKDENKLYEWAGSTQKVTLTVVK